MFSAGGTLAALAAAGWRVRVVTCFTASVADPSPFALSTQLDKGLAADVDYMALRRAEDAAAVALLGAEPVHLPLPEAPHRGYTSAPDLFAGRHADDDVAGPLADALAPHVSDADLVLAPQAIGDHVDHRVVVDVVAALRPDALFWRDAPYVLRRPDASAWQGVPEAPSSPWTIAAHLGHQGRRRPLLRHPAGLPVRRARSRWRPTWRPWPGRRRRRVRPPGPCEVFLGAR